MVTVSARVPGVAACTCRSDVGRGGAARGEVADARDLPGTVKFEYNSMSPRAYRVLRREEGMQLPDTVDCS